MPSPQTTYLPSAKRARQMTVGIGALVLRHKEQLAEHDAQLDSYDAELARIAKTLNVLHMFVGLGFWARLRWLVVGK